MSIEQGRDISELFRRVSNIIRIGKVISVDYTKAKAKVKIGNLTTEYLPWLSKTPPAHDSNKITFNVDVAHKGAISVTGNITTSGKVTATGEVEGKGKKLSTHTHQFSYNAGETPSTATTEQPS